MQLPRLHASSLPRAGRADRIGRLALDAPAAEGELGLGNLDGQRPAVLALDTSFRKRVLLAALASAARALLHSQSGPHAGMWLAAIPSDAASTLAPDLMPSAALAPHGAALWCGRPVWSMHTGPPHGRAALAWFRR